jgi:hypothetical protein
MSTLSNIKRNLSLWSKIILLFKTYWYIILDIDELPNRISNIFGKSPSKEMQTMSSDEFIKSVVSGEKAEYKFVSTPPTITDEKNWTPSEATKEFAKATGRVIKEIRKQPEFKEYSKKTIEDGIALGKILAPRYKQISGSSFEVGKGYSSSYTEQREMSSWNKQ